MPLAGSDRLGGWQYCGTNSVAQCPQICHCEGALRPWQSREGATSSYRASIITHKPIASVAALIERHGGWQYLRHEFYGARFPSLSFRGAKRRGTLLQPVTFSPRPTCYPTWYCEIATSAYGRLAMTSLKACTFNGAAGNMQLPKALTERRYRRNRLVRFYLWPVRTPSASPRFPRRFAPRNDKLESFTPQNAYRRYCQPAWRSRTAMQADFWPLLIWNRQLCAGSGVPLPCNAPSAVC